MNAYEKLLGEAPGRPFAGIVGWPVEHSRSPALHGFWLKQHKIDGHYGRLPVEPRRAALEELVAFLRRTPNAPTLLAHLKASHTLTDEVGRIATQAQVKTLVLNHLVPADDPSVTEQVWTDAVRETWKGDLIVGHDLMEIAL